MKWMVWIIPVLQARLQKVSSKRSHRVSIWSQVSSKASCNRTERINLIKKVPLKCWSWKKLNNLRVSNKAVPLHTEGGDKTRLSENCVELKIASLDSVLYHWWTESFVSMSILLRYAKVSLLASTVPWRTLHLWWKLSRFFIVKKALLDY